MMVQRHQPSYQDYTERIVIVHQGLELLGATTSEAGVRNLLAAKGSLTKPCTETTTTLHRPSLRPVYGGPTLLEALWIEMDVLVDRLMTEPAEDGGDRYRAEELCWVLAIVTNAYSPDMDAIRAEAMRRWQAAEDEAAAQEEALDPDQERHNFDAAGVDGYEL